MEALQLNNTASIESYFKKVSELQDCGEQFPIEWDMVWPLVYTRKDKAIEYLKKYFMQDVDYQVFHQKVENLKGGRPTEIYEISTACLEFSIARKIPAVFEVYRQVFHKVRKSSIALPDFANPAAAARAWADEVEKKALAEAKVEELESQKHILEVQTDLQKTEIKKLAPKGQYYDSMLTADGVLVASQIANDLGFRSAQGMNQYLKKKGVIKKANGVWVLAAKYSGKDFTKMIPHKHMGDDGFEKVKEHMYWTVKGKEFLKKFRELNPEGQHKIVTPNLQHQQVLMNHSTSYLTANQ